jgi:hypothetical protein
MKETMTKMVDYSYPTSPNAQKFGFNQSGCYTVTIIFGIRTPKSLAGFATKEEAIKYAETLPHEWNWMHLKYNN